jgi:hypothetical protein
MVFFWKARTVATVVVISGCISLCVCYISGNLYARFLHHSDEVHNELAILKGEPLVFEGQESYVVQFQSRILFPFLLTQASRLHFLSASQWYILLRLVTGFFAFAVFMMVCIESGGALIKTAVFGAGALAYAMVFTFNHPVEHPTDFIDIITFSMGIWASSKRSRLGTMVIVLIGTLNHQTAALISVIWLCLWGIDSRFRLKWVECVYAGVLGVVSYGLSTAVKVWFGTDKSVHYVINGWRTIPQFIEAVRHLQPYSWPVLLIAMWLPVTLWLWSNWRSMTTNDRRLLGSCVAIIVFSSPIAYWAELRSVFLAPVVVATYVATAGEGRRSAADSAEDALGSPFREAAEAGQRC